MRNPDGRTVPLGETISGRPYRHPEDQEVLLTAYKAVLSDNAFNALVAYFRASGEFQDYGWQKPSDTQGLDRNGQWSLRRGALSLSGPTAGKTLLGIYGDGTVYEPSAADLSVFACDGQDNAYPIAATLMNDNNDSYFIWLFEVDKPATSAGSYRVAIDYSVEIDLGALSLTP